MKPFNIRISASTTLKTGLSLLGLAIVASGTLQPAFAQTDKMAPASKMSDKMDDKMGAASKMGMASKMAVAAKIGTGSFRQITHATQGTATLSLEGGKRTVKLSNFETGMGPQLHVYLVPGIVKSNAGVKALVAAKKFIDLGALKSIKGSQNYAVPAGSTLGKGASVVVWCDKFDVVFGAATLS